MPQGILRKMSVENNRPVDYYLNFDGETVHLNEFLGSNLTIEHTGEKYCVKCGAKSKKLYGEGFCYKCFISAPEADVCIIHPEKCQAHLGISRDMEWSRQNCLTEHYVYLAVTDHLKVGVTRKAHIPSRWIDQGALKAVKFAKTPYRQLAGLIEVDLKNYFSDKTNWRKMLLTLSPPDIDLTEEKRKAASYLQPEYRQYLDTDNTVYSFEYPLVTRLPDKITSVNLDKTPVLTGKLIGIKGQYLIFEGGHVINIRKFSGYFVKIRT